MAERLGGVLEIRGTVLTAGGDIGVGDNGNPITGIQGVPISSTPPSDGDVLTYVAAHSEWEPQPPAGAANFADAEVPTDSGDHQHFTLAHSPSPVASLQLFRNGVLQMPGGGNDFTLSGASITTASVWDVGDNVLAWYRY